MNNQQEQSPAVHSAIAACMADIGGVAKGRRNQQQGYNFRGIADVYLACQPAMARHGLHIVPYKVVSEETAEGQTKSGGTMYRRCQRIEFRIYAKDGSFVQLETTGEAMDTGDKAANKCMSAAMKYALIQAFAIPEEDPTVDTEHDSPEMVSGTGKGPTPLPAAPSASDKERAKRLSDLAKAINSAGIAKEHRYQWASEQLGKQIASADDLALDEIETLIVLANALRGKGAA